MCNLCWLIAMFLLSLLSFFARILPFAEHFRYSVLCIVHIILCHSKTRWTCNTFDVLTTNISSTMFSFYCSDVVYLEMVSDAFIQSFYLLFSSLHTHSKCVYIVWSFLHLNKSCCYRNIRFAVNYEPFCFYIEVNTYEYGHKRIYVSIKCGFYFIHSQSLNKQLSLNAHHLGQFGVDRNVILRRILLFYRYATKMYEKSNASSRWFWQTNWKCRFDQPVNNTIDNFKQWLHVLHHIWCIRSNKFVMKRSWLILAIDILLQAQHVNWKYCKRHFVQLRPSRFIF